MTKLDARSVDGNRDFCFSVNSDTNDKLVLQALSEENRDEWVYVLTTVASWCNHRKGTLRKKMAWKKAWKDRFCVLNGCMLTYFNGPSMGKRLGEVSLLGCDVEELPPTDGNKYSFEVITDEKVMSLQVRGPPPTPFARSLCRRCVTVVLTCLCCLSPGYERPGAWRVVEGVGSRQRWGSVSGVPRGREGGAGGGQGGEP